MPNDRDTHFQGFAELLWQELMDVHKDTGGWIDVSSDGLDADDIARYRQIIAQRAYDLVVHVLIQRFASDHYVYPEYSAREAIQDDIPDLTSWPAPQSDLPAS